MEIAQAPDPKQHLQNLQGSLNVTNTLTSLIESTPIVISKDKELINALHWLEGVRANIKNEIFATEKMAKDSKKDPETKPSVA